MSNTSHIPEHIAIIMDGNGRWAESHNLPRTQGHIEGVRRVEEIILAASAQGVKVLTLFTFSTENWSRPESEVSLLMNMISSILVQKVKVLIDHNIKFSYIGNAQGIPEQVMSSINFTMEETAKNTGMILNMAFNYGSRAEILDGIKDIYQSVKDGKISIDEISEDTVSNALYTHGLPDPDLLIRTSGEKRISNFLLWQLSYSELYFTEKYWPDFNTQELKKAIEDYQSRDRRFGKLKASVQ